MTTKVEEVKAGLFVDPLQGWPNDDLLISPAARAFWRENRPKLFRVLDWPELRAEFERHDPPANRGKKLSHLQGLMSIGLTGAGVILLGLTPAIPKTVEHVLLPIALLLMTLGGALGVLHFLVLKSRHFWLGHRLWTERLRQLFFQSLVANVDLVAEAMEDDGALEKLRQERRLLLAEFSQFASDPRMQIRKICNDHTSDFAWIVAEWKRETPISANGPDVSDLLGALRFLRLGVQDHYARLNTGVDIYAPPLRAQLLKAAGFSATVLMVVMSILAWIANFSHDGVLHIDAITWTVAIAVVSALGLMARAADEGLQNDADSDRYAWYGESIAETIRKFETAEKDRRVDILREFEEISYEELRRFLRTHQGARFLM